MPRDINVEKAKTLHLLRFHYHENVSENAIVHYNENVSTIFQRIAKHFGQLLKNYANDFVLKCDKNANFT